MTPTPAQVEAHRRAYWEMYDKTDNHDACLLAALTAAAEVQQSLAQCKAHSDAKLYGTAAAEVGEPETPLDYMLRHSIANNNATIELCAQVGDNLAKDWGVSLASDIAEEIAAAIRALKEKP